jgi:hypothetical protein
MSIVPEVDVPTTHDSTVVYFESHLIAGLGLPPSKFLVAIMNFLGCELVHFNPNAIAALNCFSMLCKYWLGIPLDTVYSGIFIPQPDTTRLFIPRSGYLFVATTARNTSMLLQELLEGFLAKVVLSRYARRATMGEHASAPTAH